MRILITGGAGFIGSNLVRVALSDPVITDIRVLDDLSTGTLANLDGMDVDVTVGSILDETALEAAVAGSDAIVHLAALPSVPWSVLHPVTSHAVNATGTVAVLQAARRHEVRHVVLASSSAVYGANPAIPKSEHDWTAPLSPYAADKLAAEGYALAFQATYGLPTLAVRLFNVYGPGQRHDHAYAAVIPRFVHAAVRAEPVVFHGDGGQTRDFTYVDTVCGIFLDALRRSVSHPGPVNLAFGDRTDLRTVVTALERITGRPIPVEHVEPRLSDVRHSAADGRLLADLFPNATAVPLAEGLTATVDWFERSGAAAVAAG